MYSSYAFSFYYNVVVAWSLVYFIVGFISPLPYSEMNPDFEDKCAKTVGRAE